MKRWMAAIALTAIAAAFVFWFASAPTSLSGQVLASMEAHSADLTNGENLFWAGGCASCHAAKDATGEARLILSGGHGLEAERGVFGVPNISPDPEDGIGEWSLADFANAMLKGVAPDGSHYYPAFPYASYAKMTPSDIADLWAFMQTLPATSDPADADQTELSFPYNIRRGVGLWKRVFVSDAPVVADSDLPTDAVMLRGRYLVEGAGHCGECHTPRNLAFAMDASNWLAGAPNPDGRGRVPNITPGADGIESWSADDIAYGLETGFTPTFDSMGSSMASVVKNYANVAPQDRLAIAAYLKAIDPKPNRQ